MKRASILKQEVMQERRFKASFRYRDDIFIVAESGNGNVETLWRHWKFVANQNRSPYLIEGWVVSSDSVVFLDTFVERAEMRDTVTDWFQNTHKTVSLGCSAVSAKFSSKVGTQVVATG